MPADPGYKEIWLAQIAPVPVQCLAPCVSDVFDWLAD